MQLLQAQESCQKKGGIPANKPNQRKMREREFDFLDVVFSSPMFADATEGSCKDFWRVQHCPFFLNIVIFWDINWRLFKAASNSNERKILISVSLYFQHAVKTTFHFVAKKP